MTRLALIIPTRNAQPHLDRLLPALKAQTRQPDTVLVVDSSSADDTVSRFRAFGALVHVIAANDFNHGGTRRWASQHVDADAMILLTQDAIPATAQTFANLLDELQQDPRIGVAYGRQLPHPGAGYSKHNRDGSTTPVRAVPKAWPMPRNSGSRPVSVRTPFRSIAAARWMPSAVSRLT